MSTAASYERKRFSSLYYFGFPPTTIISSFKTTAVCKNFGYSDAFKIALKSKEWPKKNNRQFFVFATTFVAKSRIDTTSRIS